MASFNKVFDSCDARGMKLKAWLSKNKNVLVALKDSSGYARNVL